MSNDSNPLIIDIQDNLRDLHAEGRHCVVLWIPGHCGIYGNDLADENAKLAVGRDDIERYTVCPLEYLPSIRRACFEHFNSVWQNDTSRTTLKYIY